MLRKNVSNVPLAWFLLFALPVMIPAGACGGKGKDIPDVTSIAVDVQLLRFDQDLFNADTNNLPSELERFDSIYEEFSTIFFQEIMGANDPNIAPEGTAEYVRGFVTDERVRQLYDTTRLVFSDLTWLEQDLEQALRFYRYYFPDNPLPKKVVTYLSEYTIAGFLYGDNDLAIGLDFFLGSDYGYQVYNVANPNFSNYLTRTYNKDHLVFRCMQLLVRDMLGPCPGNRFIDQVVHTGKELYLLDKLLPYAQDSIRYEFSEEQLSWCRENEANIWAYFISEGLLYSTDWGKFRKFVEYSPNSPGIPDEAPGRTGSYIGRQIVSAYMERHPGTSLQELLSLKDAQAILEGSRFKPRR